MFKIVLNTFGNEIIVRVADDVALTPDPENRDWQEYQLWLEAGNAPQAANE